MLGVVRRRVGNNMKLIKLLTVATAITAASFLISACFQDYGSSASSVCLIVENITKISFYLTADDMGISGYVNANEVCTLDGKRPGSLDGSIPDITFKGDIGLHSIIDDDKPVNSKDKLFKQISNAASVVAVIEYDSDVGDAVYKIIITNKTLGFNWIYCGRER
jgi:hypothetical protein